MMTEHKTVSIADQIFEQLERDILAGEYERGEILTEAKLSEKLGVSRTPIREALRAGRANNDPEGVALQLEGWGQHAQAGKSTALAFLAHAAKRFPIMYLAGALDAKYAALAEEVSVAAPDAQVCVVPDVGHNILLEAPSAYVEELKKVLA